MLKSLCKYFRCTEIWSYENGKRHTELADPQLYDFTDYPELALVNTNFCVKP